MADMTKTNLLRLPAMVDLMAILSTSPDQTEFTLNILKLRQGRFALIGFVALVSGCVTGPVYDHMPAASYETMKQSDLVIFKLQNEINAQVRRSQIGAGGGLIPALIGAAIEHNRTKKSEALLGPIRNTLIDVNIEERLKDQVEAQFIHVNWIKQEPVPILVGNFSELIKKEVETSSADAVGILFTKYFFNRNFRRLTVSIEFALYPVSVAVKETLRSDDETEELESFYRTRVTREMLLERELRGKSKKNAEIWASNNGERLKAALKGFIDSMVLELQALLRDPTRRNAAAKS